MVVRFLLILGLLGCGSDAAEEALHHAAEQTREAEAEAEAESEPEAEQIPELTKAEQAAVVLEDTVGQALAAAHAAEVGASTCDAAYESTAELVRVVRERFPEDAREMPPRELFVDACQRLPDEAQRCLMARYAVVDALLGFGAAEALRDDLSAAGWKPSWVGFRGGHEIPMSVLEGVGTFLNSVL